jgi:hypothetical protein
MINHSRSAGREPCQRRLGFALSAAIAAYLAGVSAAMAGSDLPRAPQTQMLFAADQDGKAQSGLSGAAPNQPVGRYICTPSGAGRTSTCVRETET